MNSFCRKLEQTNKKGCTVGSLETARSIAWIEVHCLELPVADRKKEVAKGRLLAAFSSRKQSRYSEENRQFSTFPATGFRQFH